MVFSLDPSRHGVRTWTRSRSEIVKLLRKRSAAATSADTSTLSGGAKMSAAKKTAEAKKPVAPKKAVEPKKTVVARKAAAPAKPAHVRKTPNIAELTDGQRAYEARRAAKAGLSLEKWLAAKERDRLAEEKAKAKAAEATKPARPPGFFRRLLERAHKPLKS
jgi:hypothetical protein